MAPSAPTKRKPLRLKATERLANPLAPRKVHRAASAVTDAFLDTKADRQRIRHAAFVSRITKPIPTGTTTTTTTSTTRVDKNARRRARRREQQHDQGEGAAAFSAAALAAALPALTPDELAAGDAERAGRVRHRSLRSRPGALRRRERLVRGEVERFGVSLAQLAGVREEGEAAPAPGVAGTSAGGGDDSVMEDGAVRDKSASANRFAALRGFISSTLEQNPAFAQRDAAAAAAAAAGGAKGA